jgi:5-methylcytosine-specific restriction endonuclease McrA
MNQLLFMFAALADAQLLEEVHTLVARHRDITAALIAALAELDSRKLYLAEGFCSLYTYCTEHLHLSEHEAYNRIESARIAHKYPIVLDWLASGDLTMTTVNVLGPHLTDENHIALLDAARHKSKRQVEVLVGSLRPAPDFRATLTPLGDGRRRLLMVLSAEDSQTLERLQDLMRHTVPDGDVSRIVSQALRLLLAKVERRRLATVMRPKRPARVSASRYVPAAVRRAVCQRDGEQCAFVGRSGRCQERGFLELHHVIPFAEGGPTVVDNLQLRCRAHNVYESDRTKGTG